MSLSAPPPQHGDTSICENKHVQVSFEFISIERTSFCKVRRRSTRLQVGNIFSCMWVLPMQGLVIFNK